MTRYEAIQFLDNMKHEEAGRAIGKDGFYAELMSYHVQALNIAIKALEQEPKTGHWSRVSMDKYVQHAMAYYRCSECGKDIIGEHNYCPQCGAKMEVSE